MPIGRVSVEYRYRQLLSADQTYSEQQSPDTHHILVTRQRAYYQTLKEYLRATYSVQEARVRFCSALVKRAQQNRKQQLDDHDWQMMAYEQFRRAWRMLQRAKALRDLEEPTYPQPKVKGTPGRPRKQQPKPKPTHKRVQHPITRRWVYVPVEEAI